MKNISSFLKVPRNKTQSGPNSERAELVGFFADEINKERKGSKYRPVTYRY